MDRAICKQGEVIVHKVATGLRERHLLFSHEQIDSLDLAGHSLPHQPKLMGNDKKESTSRLDNLRQPVDSRAHKNHESSHTNNG
jgi:hypothetical protein